MRSHRTVDLMYRQYTQEKNLQTMAETAVAMWQARIDKVAPFKREQKVKKMLNLAAQMPHPKFVEFTQAIAASADTLSRRKKGISTRVPPVPIPAVLTGETEMQRLVRQLDVQGIILTDLYAETVNPEAEAEERTWLEAQALLVGRMKQAGLPQQCEALVDGFAKEGWKTDVVKQCVDWLGTESLESLMMGTVAELGKTWQASIDKKSSVLSVGKIAELEQARAFLRVLGVTIQSLQPLARVVPNSGQEDALAAHLKELILPLGENIGNHHLATPLHALFEAYEKDGDKAFDDVPFAGVQKQAARMYCRVMAFAHTQARAWMEQAKACIQEAKVARVDRKLTKQPNDAARLIDRARALSEQRKDTQSALAVLDGIPANKRDGHYALERAIVLGKLGRLREVLQTVDGALATPNWSDVPTLTNLFCLRAEARLYDRDPLGALADAQRAMKLTRTSPRASEVYMKVLQAVKKDRDDTRAIAKNGSAQVRDTFFAMDEARDALAEERWSAAAEILKNSPLQAPADAAAAKRVAALAQEMATFQAEMQALLKRSITPQMANTLRQRGVDPAQISLSDVQALLSMAGGGGGSDGLASILEGFEGDEGDDDDASDSGSDGG